MSTSISNSDDPTSVSSPRWWCSEDWLAIWLGLTILSFFSAVVYFAGGGPSDFANPLKHYLAAPAKWTTNPSSAFSAVSLLATLGAVWAIFAIGTSLRGVSLSRFTCGFLGVFGLAAAALVLSAQTELKYYGLEYSLWAILIGLLISNTIGTPNWLRPAMHTELYIKTGLVLLGAKVLFGVLMLLGPRGLVVAWIVTPIVLVATYWFGQSVLKIKSRTLNMVVSADMAVCGVSAAIATASACRAKKEELSLAIGISMAFTVIMMIVMPQVIKATGMNERVGGAWIGGTIDSTGAVGAAGKMVGPEAEEAAVTIKMIQNVLIGVVAFGVALYWVRFVEVTPVDGRTNAWEIWYRFPKFVIGFLVASFAFSAIAAWLPNGTKFVDAVVKNGSEMIRDWLFALAFISIGLESNFRELAKYLRGGKPVVLYVCGQSLNLALTFLMAWLMFG
ncbi:MAG: putative sulfate exporter family transporter [Pirellulaceae bacterium]